MSHICHARGCHTPVPPEKLMCLGHWKMVPKTIQRAVWRHYRDGQCDDKRPSVEWHDAANCAIGWVSLKTGEKLRRPEVAALVRRGFKMTVIRAYIARGANRQDVEKAIAAVMEETR